MAVKKLKSRLELPNFLTFKMIDLDEFKITSRICLTMKCTARLSLLLSFACMLLHYVYMKFSLQKLTGLSHCNDGKEYVIRQSSGTNLLPDWHHFLQNPKRRIKPLKSIYIFWLPK